MRGPGNLALRTHRQPRTRAHARCVRRGPTHPFLRPRPSALRGQTPGRATSRSIRWWPVPPVTDAFPPECRSGGCAQDAVTVTKPRLDRLEHERVPLTAARAIRLVRRPYLAHPWPVDIGLGVVEEPGPARHDLRADLDR